MATAACADAVAGSSFKPQATFLVFLGGIAEMPITDERNTLTGEGGSGFGCTSADDLELFVFFRPFRQAPKRDERTFMMGALLAQVGLKTVPS